MPNKELTLFDIDVYDEQRKEWQNMPEFHQANIVPYKEIILRFENQENIDKFSSITGLRITEDTKYLWYPKTPIETYMDKRYIDET